MNVTVENLAPCRKLVRVEVEASAVDAAFNQMTRDFQREAKMPGFRPGKAPLNMILRTYDKQIETEAKRKLISDSYKKALEEQKIDPVGYPDIEEIQFGRGQSLQFAATVETAPEFELPEYKGIAIKRRSNVVTDEDVERALQTIREQRANYNDVARPAATGDIVVVNYTGTSEGKPLTEFAPTARGLTQQKNFWIEIKTDSFIPGFTEQLVGVSAGEKRSVNVEFPADFVAPALSGKQGLYEVEVVQVKERVIPELNDAFAVTLGAQNLETLRSAVRGDLQNELNYKIKRDTRDQIMQALFERVQFDLPESIVQNETRSVVYNIVMENQRRGVSKEKIEEEKEKIYGVAANTAKDRVKASFLLGRIAAKENVTVSQQEIIQRILFLAQQNDIKPEKLIKQLQERNGIAEIQEQILNTKVLDLIELHAQAEEVSASPAPAAEAPQA